MRPRVTVMAARYPSLPERPLGETWLEENFPVLCAAARNAAAWTFPVRFSKGFMLPS